MSRLARIDQSLPPDQASAVEKLRRLLATLTEIELQEETTLEDGRAQEAALRAEIDDFTGGTRQVVPNAGKEAGLFTAGGGTRDILELEGASKAVVVRGGGRGQGKGGGAAVLAKTMDDPLAVAPKSPEMEADERRKKLGAVVGVGVGSGGAGLPMVLVAGGATGQGVGGDDVTGKKNTALEGKALLAEGLHRIEAAHEAAAAEREAIASRLSRLRLAVARRQREEDATPGHSELLQYLLRFEELGRHSLERQEQLRRCKAERSTMALTTELLVKEARLLETIASGVDEAARGSKGAREAYLRQVNGIVQVRGGGGDGVCGLLLVLFLSALLLFRPGCAEVVKLQRAWAYTLQLNQAIDLLVVFFSRAESVGTSLASQGLPLERRLLPFLGARSRGFHWLLPSFFFLFFFSFLQLFLDFSTVCFLQTWRLPTRF